VSKPGSRPLAAAGLQATLTQAMQRALALYSSREWVKAEQVCRMIVSAQAANFDALNLLGIITAQTRRPQEAAEFLGRAVALRRNEPTAHNNYGNVLRDLARFEDALRSYNRAIQLNPNYAEAHYNRGVTLHELKRFAEALSSYDRAIKLKPDYVAAHNNRGASLRELKRFDEALSSYDRAIALEPRYAAAHNNRGIILQELERTDAALESYAKALEANPGYAEALNNRGNALQELKRFAEALDSFERAIALNPSYADAHNGRGSALQALNQPDRALESFDRAIAIQPDRAQHHYNRGNVLRALRRNDLALDSYQRALELEPDFIDDHYNRAGILHELQRFDEALESYERAAQINPDYPWLQGVLLHARMRVCDWDGLDSHIAALISRIEQGKAATLPFVPVVLADSLALHRRASEIWVRETCPVKAELPPLDHPVGRRECREKIRVGYYSADYHTHATALLAAGLFEKHDRDRFEIVGFSFGPGQRDEMTDRLAAAFDQFVDVRMQTDVEIARLSRDMGVDIAVDLKGFTLHQRAGIFAHRAAPIQVNYLGYPATMGATFIDYIVADRTLIPRESFEHYAEKVVCLPGSYQVNDRNRVIADRPWSRAEVGLPSAGFVFCSFNNSYKITPAMFACWMRILQRVSHSVLWLLEDSETASNHLRQAAERAGVDPDRLVFSGRVSPEEHLARHRLADLFIDTFPCNAHTTASDALWAGLPILTCAGESFPSRVAASLLSAIGLPELITTSLGQYEEMAVELATHSQRLAGIAQKLDAHRLTTPLFDTELFARGLEKAFLEMYRRYQEGLAPDHIYVAG
jgi:protein O-GlcNAc transferase